MTELLPCPFCGGEASKRLFYGGKYGIYCDECSARVGGLYDTEAEAIAAWNTRAERTCEVEVRESAWGGYTRHCGNCGADLDCDTRNRQNYCPNCGAKVVDERKTNNKTGDIVTHDSGSKAVSE